MMVASEVTFLLLSYFLRTLELNFNTIFLFPKELKQLISKYAISINKWNTSLNYKFIKFSNNNTTVKINQPKTSIIGTQTYNLKTITNSLNIDFKINKLDNKHMYLGLLSYPMSK